MKNVYLRIFEYRTTDDNGYPIVLGSQFSIHDENDQTEVLYTSPHIVQPPELDPVFEDQTYLASNKWCAENNARASWIQFNARYVTRDQFASLLHCPNCGGKHINAISLERHMTFDLTEPTSIECLDCGRLGRHSYELTCAIDNWRNGNMEYDGDGANKKIRTPS